MEPTGVDGQGVSGAVLHTFVFRIQLCIWQRVQNLSVKRNQILKISVNSCISEVDGIIAQMLRMDGSNAYS